jgi:hypothetical protein
LPGLVCLYIKLFHGNWNTQAVGQINNILTIGLRFSTTQLMVQVSHMEFYTQLILEINQNM